MAGLYPPGRFWPLDPTVKTRDSGSRSSTSKATPVRFLPRSRGCDSRSRNCRKKAISLKRSLPYNVREGILDTGRYAARQLGHWADALALNAELLKSEEDRGASAFEMAQRLFQRLRSPVVAWAHRRGPRAAAELPRILTSARTASRTSVRILSALADVEAAAGHGQDAIDLEHNALRYKYLADRSSSSPSVTPTLATTWPLTSPIIGKRWHTSLQARCSVFSDRHRRRRSIPGRRGRGPRPAARRCLSADEHQRAVWHRRSRFPAFTSTACSRSSPAEPAAASGRTRYATRPRWRADRPEHPSRWVSSGLGPGDRRHHHCPRRR